jgi:hypothetical protein
MKKKKTWMLVSEFFPFLDPKTHFRERIHENKEKRLLYFGVRIPLPIQIQLLDIENPKNLKIDAPYTVD